jgi:transposase
MILKQKIALFLHYEDAPQEITSILIEMSRKLMDEEINLMTSLKGIGEKVAANFLIDMGGDINQFEHSGKIIAMAGLDPAVYQSGKHEGKGRITKRGNRHLWKIIWIMTTKVIQYIAQWHPSVLRASARAPHQWIGIFQCYHVFYNLNPSFHTDES